MEIYINRNSKRENPIANFLANISDDFYLIIFTALSTIGMFIPYNTLIKSFYAAFIIVTLIFFALKKTNIVIPIFFLVSVAPLSAYTGLFSIEVTFIVFDNYTIIVLGLLFIFLIKLLLDKQIRIKGMLPLMIITVLIALSYFYTDEYTRNTFYKAGFWCILLYYLIIPLFIRDRNDFNIMLKGYIYAIFQVAILITYKMLFIGRENVTAELYDRNYFGAYLILLITAVMVYLLTNKKVGKTFSILAIVSIFPCVIEMFQLASRTGFICLLSLCALYIVVNIRKIKNILLFAVVFAFFMIFIYDPELTKTLFERFEAEDVASGNGRADIAIAMLEHFSARPILEKLFGTGYNSVFLYVYGGHYTPHNSFISLLLHYGLIGALAFIYIIIKIIFKLFKSKQFRPYLVFIVMFLIYCFTLEPHIRPEFIFIIIGLFSIATTKNRLNVDGEKI